MTSPRVTLDEYLARLLERQPVRGRSDQHHGGRPSADSPVPGQRDSKFIRTCRPTCGPQARSSFEPATIRGSWPPWRITAKGRQMHRRHRQPQSREGCRSTALSSSARWTLLDAVVFFGIARRRARQDFPEHRVGAAGTRGISGRCRDGAAGDRAPLLHRCRGCRDVLRGQPAAPAGSCAIP